MLLGRPGLLSRRYTKGLDVLYLVDEPSVFKHEPRPQNVISEPPLPLATIRQASDMNELLPNTVTVGITHLNWLLSKQIQDR